MSIYCCNECKDIAYRGLYSRIDRFVKELDNKIKKEKNEIRKSTMMSIADNLDSIIMGG